MKSSESMTFDEEEGLSLLILSKESESEAKCEKVMRWMEATLT